MPQKPHSMMEASVHFTSLWRRDAPQLGQLLGRRFNSAARESGAGLTRASVPPSAVRVADSADDVIVDTGASVSVISDRVANEKEILRHLSEEKLRVIGAAGITEGVPSYMLPRVTFGSHSRRWIEAIAIVLDLKNEASGF